MASLSRILIAPDSFKGTLSAIDAAQAMARGVQLTLPEAKTDLCPIADGGEGTIDALLAAISNPDLETRHTEVVGPLGQSVTARWLAFDRNGVRTAVIEMAQASGIMLVPESERNPTRTTSYGTGELIAAARDFGCEEIIVGVGGSATCDGGLGAAQALGARFYDSSDRELAHPLTGGDLLRIARIQRPHSPRRLALRLRIACDVVNPLCGSSGAAVIYGPQKGATVAQVELLDRGLAHSATLLPQVDPNQPGMGAAGGIALGLCAMVDATIESGIDLVLDAVDFDARLSKANLVISGEGSFDAQSSQGKAISGIALRAARSGVPLVVIAGRASRSARDGAILKVQRVYSLTEQYGEDRAMRDTAWCIEQAAAQLAAPA